MHSRTIYTILGMLTIRPMTGYEIRQTIKNSTNYFWSESNGQIYPQLARCLKEGFATVKEISTQASKPLKKRYTITKKGKAFLKAWLLEPAKASITRNELLLKLFFGSNLPLSENVFHVQSHLKACKSKLKTFSSIRSKLIKEEKNSIHLRYWLLTLDCGSSHLDCEIVWCKKTLKLLEGKKS